MPFNKRDKNQDVLMADIMTPEESDPSLLQAEDITIEGQDRARLRRILKFTDNAVKSPLGSPAPARNRAGGPPRKSKSKS